MASAGPNTPAAVGLTRPQRLSLLKSADWFNATRGKDDLRRRLVAAARKQLADEEATLARVAGNVRNLRTWLERQEELP